MSVAEEEAAAEAASPPALAGGGVVSSKVSWRCCLEVGWPVERRTFYLRRSRQV